MLIEYGGSCGYWRWVFCGVYSQPVVETEGLCWSDRSSGGWVSRRGSGRLEFVDISHPSRSSGALRLRSSCIGIDLWIGLAGPTVWSRKPNDGSWRSAGTWRRRGDLLVEVLWFVDAVVDGSVRWFKARDCNAFCSTSGEADVKSGWRS